MATINKILDDLDQSDGASTVRISVGDEAVDIDLSPANVDKLGKVLAVYFEKGRPVVKKASADGGELTLIREWAAAQVPPIEVASKGRIAADVVERYRAAHPNGAAPTA